LRFVLRLLLMFALALGVGFGLSYFALTDGRLFSAFQVGPWIAWPAAGSQSPDPYTRAYLARAGALELGQSEGLQFTATTDSAGVPLTRNCRYRIEGQTPTATFWTLVAVDAAGVNIARPDGITALSSTRLARANDGAILLYVSESLAPANWLEISGTGPFSLVLTLYDSAILSGFGSDAQTMPSITQDGCS
jgi:hypothetical protein